MTSTRNYLPGDHVRLNERLGTVVEVVLGYGSPLDPCYLVLMRDGTSEFVSWQSLQPRLNLVQSIGQQLRKLACR